MKYDNMAVLLFGQNENLKHDLEQGGIEVLSFSCTGLCDSLTTALNLSSAQGFLTVSAQDSFAASDVFSVADALQSNSENIYIGERALPAKKTLAQNIYGFLSGLDTKDITSSLYGMSREHLALIAESGNRDKAFFSNISLTARAKGIDICNVTTGAALTAAPGFELLTSSMKLYMVFIKFSISAFIAYLIDIGTFYLFQKLFSVLNDEFKILTATVLSRILCSVATYLLNKGAVFGSHAKSTGTVVRFVILAIGQLVASWLLVWGLGSLFGGGDAVNTMLKVVVDLVIFIASFTLQRDWVFKESRGILK
ncbi:MAG: GtrA family protein [Christensenella sp.]